MTDLGGHSLNGTGFTARVSDGARLSAADVLAWRDLLRIAAPQGHAFLTPTFTAAAARAFGRVQVCFIEDGAGIAAILPYQYLSPFSAVMKAGVRVGEEMNDLFSIIARPTFRCSPGEMLRFAGLNYLYFTHLEETQSQYGLTGEQPSGGLRILLPNGGARYLEDLSRTNPKFSKDTERRERRAEKDIGPIRFCLRESNPTMWLQQVIAAKRAQYLRTKNIDWLAAPGRRKLLELLAHSNDPDCSPVVSTLMFGDTWAAIHFGLTSKNTLHYWFPVYNPSFAAYAPGRLLLHHVIANAHEAGIQVIDRGAGESQAKMDFPSERHLFYTGAWHTSSLRAFVYAGYRSASSRLSRLRRQ